MAEPQATLTPYSGLENESLREFELLHRSILAAAALPANQQAIFFTIACSRCCLILFSNFASSDT